MNPECYCESAGYCTRHAVPKSTRMIELCKQRGEYWEAWEAGRGPLQNIPAVRVEPKQEPAYNHWCSLHYYGPRNRDRWNPRVAKRWYRAWEVAIPNSRGCGCREKWLALKFQFDFSTPVTFFESTWAAHNAVSAAIGKPRITLAECYSVWWPTAF